MLKMLQNITKETKNTFTYCKDSPLKDFPAKDVLANKREMNKREGNSILFPIQLAIHAC